MATEVEHSLSEHISRLAKLCRICAQRINRRNKDRHSPICINYFKELVVLHDIDVSQDDEYTHPKTMCTRCHRRLFRCRDRPSQTTLDNAAGQIDRASRIWDKYNQAKSVSECSSCHHFQQQCGGGRPFKPKVGRRSKKTGWEPASLLLSQKDDCRMEKDCTVMPVSTTTP